jgi:hypothetical protein
MSAVRRWLVRVWDRVTRPYVPTRRHETAVALLEQEVRYLRGMLGVQRTLLLRADERVLAAEEERDALISQAAVLTRQVRREWTLPSLAHPGPALHLDLAADFSDSVMSAGAWQALLGVPPGPLALPDAEGVSA